MMQSRAGNAFAATIKLIRPNWRSLWSLKERSAKPRIVLTSINMWTITMTAHESVKLLAQRLLERDFSEIPARERRVIERVAKRVAVSRDPADIEESTFGQRLADQVASFGGSWTFLIIFAAILVFWVALNALLAARAFDPYPYILLNLFLSMLASIQAPIIMMSQNRLAAKDRIQATHDYEVNLKAEIEIMALHDKLDEMRSKDLAELIQHLQLRKT
jgi:uncharacterized membrane protein